VVALAACALAALAVAAVLIAGGGDEAGQAAAVDVPQPVPLDVLSPHPLNQRGIERVLTDRYLAVPDDDETDVRCSGREPRPAHSVRRCHILYLGGTDHTIRTVVVITTANGSEVLSEP
jgi:hypothetical protein